MKAGCGKDGPGIEGLDGDSGIGGLGEDGRWRQLLRIHERRAPESDWEIADAHQRCDHLGRFGKGAICEGPRGLRSRLRVARLERSRGGDCFTGDRLGTRAWRSLLYSDDIPERMQG